MKLLILGGFLGSGKTSVLLQLAKFIVENYISDSEYKVAIIENEVGQVGVDDKALKAGGYTVENIFAGCACCTVSGDVPMVIDKIRRELNPEWIIMEATGVAYPRSIRENMLAALKLESRITAIVDASRWLRLLGPMWSLIGGQLEDCETILVNKIDLVDEETLAQVTASVREYNSTADLFHVTANEEISHDVWRKVLDI